MLALSKVPLKEDCIIKWSLQKFLNKAREGDEQTEFVFKMCLNIWFKYIPHQRHSATLLWEFKYHCWHPTMPPLALAWDYNNILWCYFFLKIPCTCAKWQKTDNFETALSIEDELRRPRPSRILELDRACGATPTRIGSLGRMYNVLWLTGGLSGLGLEWGSFLSV